MKRYATLDEEKRIRATTIPAMEGQEPVESQVLIDFPEDFDFVRQQDWKWADEALAYDPIPEPEPPPDYIAFLMGLMEGYESE